MNFETGDMVTSPIFGKGIVIETYGEKVIVDFQNKTFGLRTMPKDLFTADPKRLIKKKDIKPDYKEDYYNDIHREDEVLSNDML